MIGCQLFGTIRHQGALRRNNLLNDSQELRCRVAFYIELFPILIADRCKVLYVLISGMSLVGPRVKGNAVRP